jgi:hypothetical protein
MYNATSTTWCFRSSPVANCVPKTLHLNIRFTVHAITVHPYPIQPTTFQPHSVLIFLPASVSGGGGDATGGGGDATGGGGDAK